eukprot:6188774-Pleurochrysis_carterae.AAC.1
MVEPSRHDCHLVPYDHFLPNFLPKCERIERGCIGRARARTLRVSLRRRRVTGLRLCVLRSGATSGAASSSDGAASACVRSDAPHAQPIVCENQGKVGEVRYSLNHRFAAVQRSETTVELLDLLLHNSFELAARGAGAKARWRILGFRWTGARAPSWRAPCSAGGQGARGADSVVTGAAHSLCARCAWAQRTLACGATPCIDGCLS